MIKKITTILLVCCLLGENLAFANTNNKNKSLVQIQKQAQADWAALQNRLKLPSKDLLPTLLAVAPMVWVKQSKIKELETRLAAAEERAATAESLAQQRIDKIRQEAAVFEQQALDAQAQNAELTKAVQKLEKKLANAKSLLTQPFLPPDEIHKEVIRLSQELTELERKRNLIPNSAVKIQKMRTQLIRLQEMYDKQITAIKAADLSIPGIQKTIERQHKVLCRFHTLLTEKEAEIAALKAAGVTPPVVTPSFSLEMYQSLETQNLKQELALQKGIIKSLRHEIAVLKNTPLNQLTGLADEKVLVGFFERMSTNLSYQDIMLSASLPATAQYDEIVSKLLDALEKGDEAAFEQQAKEIFFQTKVEDRGAMSQLITTLQKSYSQEKKFNTNLVEQVLPTFNELLRNNKGFKGNFLARSFGKQLLKRAGLLSVFLITVGTLGSYGKTHQEGMNIAQRISRNPELFTKANAKELAIIKATPLANQAAREIAEILHASLSLTTEDIQAFCKPKYSVPVITLK